MEDWFIGSYLSMFNKWRQEFSLGFRAKVRLNTKMYKLICFMELKGDLSNMKLYSPCIQLNNYSEGEILYIGYRLLYLKKKRPQKIS